jgi:hypothetical protein
MNADHFAKALLMPEDLFRAAIGEAGEGFPAVSYLAERCKTSITASGIRYAQLVEDAVATIISSDSKIECCFLSDTLSSVLRRTSLRKGSPVPRRTSTYTLNVNAERIARTEHSESWTRLDAWFDDAPSVEAKEDAVGLGSYGKVLTVLFTTEPVDLDEDDEHPEVGDADHGWKWA